MKYMQYSLKRHYNMTEALIYLIINRMRDRFEKYKLKTLRQHKAIGMQLLKSLKKHVV